MLNKFIALPFNDSSAQLLRCRQQDRQHPHCPVTARLWIGRGYLTQSYQQQQAAVEVGNCLIERAVALARQPFGLQLCQHAIQAVLIPMHFDPAEATDYLRWFNRRA